MPTVWVDMIERPLFLDGHELDTRTSFAPETDEHRFNRWRTDAFRRGSRGGTCHFQRNGFPREFMKEPHLPAIASIGDS